MPSRRSADTVSSRGAEEGGGFRGAVRRVRESRLSARNGFELRWLRQGLLRA
jgi:hypothetical protein